MRCYFLRHGIAVDPESYSGSDFERPLTRQGRERLAYEAKAIDALSLDLDCILTSPLLRAQQTAEIVAEQLGMTDKLMADPRLGPGFNLEHLRGIVRDRAKSDAIMLVGHEPSMSATIGRAIGNANIELKKAALAGVAVDDDASGGLLLCLIPPKALVALGKR
jgi:phosphohistidine phosphatase